MKKITLLFASLVCGISSNYALDYNWEEQVITSKAELLQGITVSDDNTATIIGYGNVMKQSKDGGSTWNSTGIFEKDDFDYQDISFVGNNGFAVAMTGYTIVDRPNGGYADLMANSPLLKTTDAGATWELITVKKMGAGSDSTIHPSAAGNHTVKFTAVEMIDANTVYIGVYWKDINNKVHQNALKSADGGATWTALLPDNGNNGITSILAYNGNVYITGKETLYKVNNTTNAVTNLYPVVDKDSDDAMYFWNITECNGELIFPSTLDSIRVTADEGVTFKAIPNVKGSNYAYKDGNNIVLCGSGANTKASADGGATWTAISAGEPLWNAEVVGDSLIALGKSNIYTMATADIANGTFAWKKKNISNISAMLKGIATDGTNTYIAGWSGQLLKSTDNGQTFTQMTIPSESDIIYASVDMELKSISQGKDGNAIMSTRRQKLAKIGTLDVYTSGFLFTTTDNWATFNVLNEKNVGAQYSEKSKNPNAAGCFGQDYFTSACVDANTYYTFVQWFDTTGIADYKDKETYGRVFKTTDAGATWTAITEDLGNLFIYDIKVENDTVYIAGNKTLLKSTDGGATFENKSDKLTATGATDPFLWDIAIDANMLYLPTTNDGILISNDYGKTFTAHTGVSGANTFIALDNNSWMTLGSVAKCYYTNDAGAKWEGCYPGAVVFGSTILNNNIVALCKSKIYKLDIETLDANTATSIDENDAADSNIKVWQANEMLNVEATEVITMVNIYNVNGQLVKQSAANANNAQVEVSTLTNGIYIVNVITENGGFATTKVLIK